MILSWGLGLIFSNLNTLKIFIRNYTEKHLLLIAYFLLKIFTPIQLLINSFVLSRLLLYT